MPSSDRQTLGPQAASFGGKCGHASIKVDARAVVLGLALGTLLVLEGWGGLRSAWMFVLEQSLWLLGGILVALSIAVLVRQVRSRSAAPSQAPAAETAPNTESRGAA